MQTFKNLIITATDSQIQKLVKKISINIANDRLWSIKENTNNKILNVGKVYNFQRAKDGQLPDSGLSLFPQKEGNAWYVPNVVPIGSGQLSIDEYNEILTEFFEKFVDPLTDQLKIVATISSGRVDIKGLVGDAAATSLSNFSNNANKSTGSNHPSDRKRWIKFIIEAYRFDKRIDTDLLLRFLIAQGWDEESATKLVIQFEFAGDVIDYVQNQS